MGGWGVGGRKEEKRSVPSKNVTHKRLCWERGDQGGNRALDMNTEQTPTGQEEQRGGVQPEQD